MCENEIELPGEARESTDKKKNARKSGRKRPKVLQANLRDFEKHDQEGWWNTDPLH